MPKWFLGPLVPGTPSWWASVVQQMYVSYKDLYTNLTETQHTNRHPRATQRPQTEALWKPSGPPKEPKAPKWMPPGPQIAHKMRNLRSGGFIRGLLLEGYFFVFTVFLFLIVFTEKRREMSDSELLHSPLHVRIMRLTQGLLINFSRRNSSKRPLQWSKRLLKCSLGLTKATKMEPCRANWSQKILQKPMGLPKITAKARKSTSKKAPKR